MANNFVSYADMTTLMTSIGNKFKALSGAYIARGSSAFASLPATLTASMLGYVYNVTDAFTTDARFVEGAGKDYPAGSNVVVVDTDTTGSSPDYKFDVIGGFVDLSDLETAISNVAGMIAGSFSTSASYSIGDVVVKDNHLYKFKSAHTAGAWNAAEVDQVTVDDLIQATATAAAAAATAAANAAKTTVESNMTETFDDTKAYAVGDVVIYNDVMYKFKTAHAAGPWNAAEVDAKTVADLVDEAEPEPLTPSQISDLEALLG